MSPLRTFAFGPSSEDLWLAGWLPPAGAGVLLVAGRSGLQAREARLHGEAPAEAWQVSADGAELELTPTSADAVVAGQTGVVEGFEQAAQCSGQIDGVDVAAVGRRGERGDDGELARCDSLREVAAWFEDGGVVAVTALRPRKAKGHEQDALRTAVVDPEGFGPVTDPRVSTTYAADGRPRRVGFELWSEDEDAPALRLAAEALPGGGSLSAGGWELTVDWLRAHRRGCEGAGAYLVARPA